MAIIDAALVLIDGEGHSNVMDMFKPTTGGHNNLSGWVNIRTTGTTGSVKLQESDDNSSYSDIAGASVTFTAAGHAAIVFPKTTKRYVKAVLSSGASDDLTTSNTSVYVGGLSEAKELA